MNIFRFQKAHDQSMIETLIKAFSKTVFQNEKAIESGCNHPFNEASTQKLNISKELAKNGIVTFSNVINSDYAKNFGSIFEKRIREILKNQDLYKTETSSVFIQGPTSFKYTDYYEMVNSGKAVFNQRPMPDLGFIDLFNPAIAIPEIKELISLIDLSPIIDILNNSGIRHNYRLSNINLYFNSGHANTRYFHADSYIDQAKFFVLLTDLSSLEDGAHQYVLNSHRDINLRSLNETFNKHLPDIASGTDFTLFNRENIRTVLGPAGSGFLSFQSGAHRGHPQAEESMRIVLVFNFKSDELSGEKTIEPHTSKTHLVSLSNIKKFFS